MQKDQLEDRRERSPANETISPELRAGCLQPQGAGGQERAHTHQESKRTSRRDGNRLRSDVTHLGREGVGG